MTTILRTIHSRVATLTLNRPEKRNALTVDMLDQFVTTLADTAADQDVRAVVLTGAGGAFCAGADLTEFADRPQDPGRSRRTALVSEAMRLLQRLPQPVIAAVAGPAIGAGWGLSLSCDITYAARDAVFRLPEIVKGFRLPPAIPARLREVVGQVHAADILLAGEPHGASDGLAAGWVARVVDGPETVLAAAADVAARVAEQPAETIARTLPILRHRAPAPDQFETSCQGGT